MAGSGLSFLAKGERVCSRTESLRNMNQMKYVDSESNKLTVKGERDVRQIREFLQDLGIWWYQGITVNFVRYGNGIPLMYLMYENIHLLEMLTEVYKSKMTLFALKSESKGGRNGIYESSVV